MRGRGFVLEVVRVALDAIRSNKLRSVLTMLGIVIGIVTVTAMAAVINSIENEFEGTLSSLGADVLYVQKMPALPDLSRIWEYMNRPALDGEPPCISSAPGASCRRESAVCGAVQSSVISTPGVRARLAMAQPVNSRSRRASSSASVKPSSSRR